MDHEHFRLKILYKQKKKISNELKEMTAENKGLQVFHAFDSISKDFLKFLCKFGLCIFFRETERQKGKM